MMIIAVTAETLYLLQNFISNMGDSSNSFRYFIKRDITVIHQHLTTLLAVEKNTPIAYGHLEAEEGVVWLGICVRQEYKGKGYGKQMMEALIEQAKLENINKISLTVDKTNAGAISLYEQCGFKKINEKEHYYFYQLGLSS